MRNSVVLIMVLGLMVAFMAVPAVSHSPTVAPALNNRDVGFSFGNTSSLNWAGYAVTGSDYSVTNVTASFTIPTVNTGGNSYAAFWVGIDGFNDNTVEQTGILAEPSGHGPHATTVYEVWYEFYPAAPVYANFSAAPGDYVYAWVNYNVTSGIFTTFIKVTSSSGTVGILKDSQTVSGALAKSAEWIVEAPSSVSGILPLADFGTAYFGMNYTGISNTNYATVSGATGSIGSFSSNTSITMVSSSGTPEAVPSPLNDNGTSFYVTYVQSSSSGHSHGGK